MDIKLTDSHCHLNLLDYQKLGTTLEEVLQTAHSSGVRHLLNVAINLDNIKDILEVADAHAQVSASVGVHPNETPAQEPDVATLVHLAQHPKVVAIGETGLDYYRGNEHMALQKKRFITHINAAIETCKPLIIHTRAAQKDTMTLLRDHQAQRAGGVMHCFTEDWAMAKEALDIGFYISFSGILTFKNATDIREVAKKTPLDRILIETDAPYLAPMPYRGKTNQPAYVYHVAQQMAEIHSTSIENIAQITTENYLKLFKPSYLYH